MLKDPFFDSTIPVGHLKTSQEFEDPKGHLWGPSDLFTEPIPRQRIGPAVGSHMVGLSVSDGFVDPYVHRER